HRHDAKQAIGVNMLPQDALEAGGVHAHQDTQRTNRTKTQNPIPTSSPRELGVPSIPGLDFNHIHFSSPLRTCFISEFSDVALHPATQKRPRTTQIPANSDLPCEVLDGFKFPVRCGGSEPGRIPGSD